MRLGVIVIAKFMISLSEMCNNETGFEYTLLEDAVFRGTSSYINNKQLYRDRSGELRHLYFRNKPLNKSILLSGQTTQLLNTNRKCIEALFNMVADNNNVQQNKSVFSQSSLNKLSRKLSQKEYLDIENVMDICFMEMQRNDDSGNIQDALEKCWKEMFQEEHGNTNIRSLISQAAASDHYFEAMMLFLSTKTLKIIRSQKFVRTIIIRHVVRFLIAKMGTAIKEAQIVEETLDMLTNIDYISMGKEEEDIKEYINRYYIVDGVVSATLVRKVVSCSESINGVYRIIKEDMVNRYTRKALEEQRQIIESMGNQIESAEVFAMKRILDCLTSEYYDSILGNLYRFAMEYDTPDIEALRHTVLRMFSALSLLGITPTQGESLVELIGEAEDSRGEVIFPGWSIFGDIVISPVYEE